MLNDDDNVVVRAAVGRRPEHSPRSTWTGWRRVTHESQLDPRFAEELAAIPGGDRLRECIQCGTCSAVCPLSSYMDYTPRQVIAMTRAGFKDDVLRSKSIWICASCYACTVECPKQIPITEVMHAFKRTAIAQGVHPKRFATAVLARAFVGQVDKWGRNTESRLAVSLYLRTRPSLILKDAPLGRRLMRRGRMSLRRESVRGRAQLKTILRTIEAAKETT